MDTFKFLYTLHGAEIEHFKNTSSTPSSWQWKVLKDFYSYEISTCKSKYK
jgi:hypothetical protein